MKKSMGTIAYFAATAIIPMGIWLPRCGSGEDYSASGKNINVHSASDSEVYFKPVCPECGHISSLYSVNLSKKRKPRNGSSMRILLGSL